MLTVAVVKIRYWFTLERDKIFENLFIKWISNMSFIKIFSIMKIFVIYKKNNLEKKNLFMNKILFLTASPYTRWPRMARQRWDSSLQQWRGCRTRWRGCQQPYIITTENILLATKIFQSCRTWWKRCQRCQQPDRVSEYCFLNFSLMSTNTH